MADMNGKNNAFSSITDRSGSKYEIVVREDGIYIPELIHDSVFYRKIPKNTILEVLSAYREDIIKMLKGEEFDPPF